MAGAGGKPLRLHKGNQDRPVDGRGRPSEGGEVIDTDGVDLGGWWGHGTLPS
jgi:hypothetical protein